MTENTAGTPATVTEIAPKRASAATRKAALNARPAAKTPAKVAAKKVAPAKPAAKSVKVAKVVKAAGPTATAMKQQVSAAMIRAVADMIAKWPAKSQVPAESLQLLPRCRR